MSRLPLVLAVLLPLGCTGAAADDEADSDDDDVGSGSMSAWVDTSRTSHLVRLTDGATAWVIAPAYCEYDGGEQVCSFDVTVTAGVGQGSCASCTDQELEMELRLSNSGQLLLESVKLLSGNGMVEGVRIASMDLPLTPEPPFEVNELVLVGGEVLGVDLSVLRTGWVLLDNGPGFADATGTTWNGCRTFAYTDVGGESEIDGGAIVTACAGAGVVQVGLSRGGRPTGADPYGDIGSSSIFVRGD